MRVSIDGDAVEAAVEVFGHEWLKRARAHVESLNDVAGAPVFVTEFRGEGQIVVSGWLKLPWDLRAEVRRALLESFEAEERYLERAAARAAKRDDELSSAYREWNRRLN